jgi:hypothetical protein
MFQLAEEERLLQSNMFWSSLLQQAPLIIRVKICLKHLVVSLRLVIAIHIQSVQE